MIGCLPVADLAPLDYRYALDAAMPFLYDRRSVLVRCAVPSLLAEVRQRLPHAVAHGVVDAGCWVEPQFASWQDDLTAFAAALPPLAPLAIVVSQPLARLSAERRAWLTASLGSRPRGSHALQSALRQRGFTIVARHGIHSVRAILLSMLAQRCEQSGVPALGDRLNFNARLHFRTDGLGRVAAPVALLFARRGQQ